MSIHSAYSKKLLSPAWQKKRLEILNRDKWKCQYCGDKKTELHVHHLKYTGKNPQDAPSTDLTTACKRCHKVITYLEKNFNDEPTFLRKELFGRGYELFVYTILGRDNLAYMFYYDFGFDKVRFNREGTERVREHLKTIIPPNHKNPDALQ